MKKILYFALILSNSCALKGMEVKEWSLVDSYDTNDEVRPQVSEEDTLQQFLIDHEEDTLDEIKDMLEPLLDQVGKKCSNNQIEPPFIYAAKKGKASLIKYILEEIKPIIEQSLLDQALHGAVLYNHADLALYLLEKGANPNGYARPQISSCLEQTTLDVAFEDIQKQPKKSPNYALVKGLLCSGANGSSLRGINNKKWYAFLRKHPELRKLFILRRLFNTRLPSLKELCIAHFAIPRLSGNVLLPTPETIHQFPVLTEMLGQAMHIISENRLITPAAKTALTMEEYIYYRFIEPHIEQ